MVGKEIVIKIPNSDDHYEWIMSPLWLRFSSVQLLSHVQLCNPMDARSPCPSPTPGVDSNSCPLSWWCHPAIWSSVDPSPPAFNLSQRQGLFQWVSSSHQMAKLLELQLQHQPFQWTPRTGLVASPCSPSGSQESSLTPLFKSINCLSLSFLYGPTLTSIHDQWTNHSFD